MGDTSLEVEHFIAGGRMGHCSRGGVRRGFVATDDVRVHVPKRALNGVAGTGVGTLHTAAASRFGDGRGAG